MAVQHQSTLIVHVESPNDTGQGDHVYRTRQPSKALAELPDVQVVSGSLLSRSMLGLMEEADVLVLCDVADPDLLGVVRRRREARKLTVYEVNDNYLAPLLGSDMSALSADLLQRSLFSQLAHLSHGLQLNTPELDRRFGHLNGRRALFPNHLWEPPARREKGQPIRLGWGGSRGHLADVTWMMPAVRRALERHPEVHLSVMGHPDFKALYAWAPPGRFEFIPGGTVEEYYRFLNRLHVGLCPLLPSEFNRCRSDVKFLEYASHGVLALCSGLEPYTQTVRQGENGYVFRTLDELETLLDQVLNDLPGQRPVVERAYQEVVTSRLERPHAADRMSFYRELAAQGEMSLVSRHPPQAPRDLLKRSSYRQIADEDVDLLLRKGMALTRDAQPADARRCYLEAMRRAPGFYRPYLLFGALDPATEDSLPALRMAARLNPMSASALYLIGLRLRALKRYEESHAAFQQCAILEPSFGAAELALGELAEAAGSRETALAHYARAHEQNAFYATPTLKLSLHAIETGDTETALQLLQPAIKTDGELWLLYFALGRALVQAGRFQEASEALEHALPRATDPKPVLAQLARARLGLGDTAAARILLGSLKEHEQRAAG